MCDHNISLNNKPAVYTYTGSNTLSLKWTPHRHELLSTVHRRNGYFDNRWGFVNTVSNSAGSQNVLTDEK